MTVHFGYLVIADIPAFADAVSKYILVGTSECIDDGIAFLIFDRDVYRVRESEDLIVKNPHDPPFRNFFLLATHGTLPEITLFLR